jgi:hypothetical protein
MVVSDPAQVEANDRLQIRVREGEFGARAE